MSIKPIYSQAILAGEKTVEFRRVFGDAAAQADRVMIYESSPTMRIVGSFGIERVDKPAHDHRKADELEQIWRNMRQSGAKPGIEYIDLIKYFGFKKSPCAIYIKDVVRYEIPIDPRQIDPGFFPPQSYRWLPESLADVCEATEWGNRVAAQTRAESEKK